MTMTPNSINNISYYEDLASEDYYENGGEPAGVFTGSGAAALGLTGELKEGQLKRMLEGFHPTTGKPLASNAGEDHRAGYDLSFSAPKSISTVWAATQDENLKQAIQQAQKKAVDRAIKHMEQSGIAEVRRGKGGIERSPAKLIAATFEHGTSRAEDPQLHTHCLVASHAIDATDGSIKSLESQKFWATQKEIGAVYRAELASSMQELGFSIERDKQAFRITGSPESLEKEWSKRREAIEERMKETGNYSAKAAEIAALSTREVKGHIDRKTLMNQWQNDAIKHEFNVESIRNIEAPKLTFKPEEVLQNLTEMRAVFTETTLKTEIMQGLQGVDTVDSLDAYIKEMTDSGELILLGKDYKNQLQMTTKEMLELEKQCVSFAEKGVELNDWNVEENQINNAINNKKDISKEQQIALKHVCSKGQVVSITGAAGTGKSFMLAAAKEAFEASGHGVIGCSLSGKAAAELESGSGIKSQTIHSLLNDLEKNRIQLNNKSVVVMDEAGMTDTKLMARVVQQVEKSGAKLVLVGDTNQLQSIGAGGVFGNISEKIGSAEIITVRRQQVEWQKEAAMNIRSGQSVAALKAFNDNDRLIIKDTNQDAHKSMINAWRESEGSMSEKLMIAGKRVDVSSLNKEARTQLQAERKLKHEIPVQLKDNETGAYRTLNLATGDRLKLTKNNKELDVKNGDLCSVKRLEFTDNELKIHIELDRGGSRIINPTEYSNMMHGYAITAHASQGATVDRAFFYASSFNSKELAYVAASRHRHDAFIFGSKQELGEEPVKRLEQSFSRIDEKITALQAKEAIELLEENKISKINNVELLKEITYETEIEAEEEIEVEFE